MKQQIICDKCAKETRLRFPTDNPYPMEHIKLVEGIAKRDYTCDDCENKILENDTCTAFSIWADHGRIPYYEWEEKFINKITK